MEEIVYFLLSSIVIKILGTLINIDNELILTQEFKEEVIVKLLDNLIIDTEFIRKLKENSLYINQERLEELKESYLKKIFVIDKITIIGGINLNELINFIVKDFINFIDDEMIKERREKSDKIIEIIFNITIVILKTLIIIKEGLKIIKN